MSLCEILDFSVSVMLVNKVTGFSFKLVVVYGSSYEHGKHNFLDELEKVMSSWQGPIESAIKPGFGDNDHAIREIMRFIEMTRREFMFEDATRNEGAPNYKYR